MQHPNVSRFMDELWLKALTLSPQGKVIELCDAAGFDKDEIEMVCHYRTVLNARLSTLTALEEIHDTVCATLSNPLVRSAIELVEEEDRLRKSFSYKLGRLLSGLRRKK